MFAPKKSFVKVRHILLKLVCFARVVPLLNGEILLSKRILIKLYKN